MISRFERQWADPRPYIEARTSGSTGTPKTIRLLKSDMLRSAEATNRFFGIDRRSRLLCPLSLDYIAGKMMWVRAFAAGAEVRFIEPTLNLREALTDCEADLLPIVPAQIESLVAADCAKRIRNVIVGGAPVSPLQERLLAESGITAWATYGMTETCSHTALRRIGRDAAFSPLEGYSMTLDSRGCLVIENPAMSFGRLATNDLATIDFEGRFRILGRFDNVIISGGEKLFPESMEQAVGAVWAERPFYFTWRESRRWGQECVAAIEGEADEAVEASFIEACRETLPRHHRPKAVVWLARFDRTASGKLRRLSGSFA